MDYKKAEKGNNGKCLTRDVDKISATPLKTDKISSGKSKPATSGIESVASSPEEPRRIAWDWINKG